MVQEGSSGQVSENYVTFIEMPESMNFRVKGVFTLCLLRPLLYYWQFSRLFSSFLKLHVGSLQKRHWIAGNPPH